MEVGLIDKEFIFKQQLDKYVSERAHWAKIALNAMKAYQNIAKLAIYTYFDQAAYTNLVTTHSIQTNKSHMQT